MDRCFFRSISHVVTKWVRNRSHHVSHPGVSNAVAVAADGDTLWVVRPRRLKRWLVVEGTTPTRIASEPLGGRGWDVAAGSGLALVATNHGVQAVRATASGFTMGEPLLVCGHAVRIDRVSESVWAVATTLGHALVGVRNGNAELLSQFWLFPDGDAGGAVMPIGTDAWTMAACRAVARGGHLDSWVRKSSAMVGVGSRLILASGGRIFDLDVSRPDALEVRGRLDVWEPIAELRADRWGERAYGVSGQGSHQAHPTFDLRDGNLSSGSEHDIGSWVERRDGTGWTAMVRKNGRVVVAEVLR